MNKTRVDGYGVQRAGAASEDVMSGREWLESFKKHYECKIEDYEEGLKGHKEEGGEWTSFIVSRVIGAVGEDFGCYVVSRGKQKAGESGEYLNIDALFLDESVAPILYNAKSEYDDPRILPKAAIEHENLYDPDKISYCLWKILCVRAVVRVLICYQKNESKVGELKRLLEKIIRAGELMEGEDGDLLVIIANEKNGGKPFEEYFSVFEWRNDRLEEIEV